MRLNHAYQLPQNRLKLRPATIGATFQRTDCYGTARMGMGTKRLVSLPIPILAVPVCNRRFN